MKGDSVLLDMVKYGSLIMLWQREKEMEKEETFSAYTKKISLLLRIRFGRCRESAFLSYCRVTMDHSFKSIWMVVIKYYCVGGAGALGESGERKTNSGYCMESG